MKTILKMIPVILLVIPDFFILKAQYTFFTPRENFAIEVSLPKTSLQRLPEYRNAISSLMVVGDRILAGTSAKEGLAPFIFVASLARHQMKEVHDLEKFIPGQRAVASGFCPGTDHVVYTGTLANKKHDGSEGDGHLIRLNITEDENVQIIDLGTISSGQGVFSLAIDAEKENLYGVLYPSGQFFSYNITKKEIKIRSFTAPAQEQINLFREYDMGPDKYLSKSLIEVNGHIFGGMPINKIFCYYIDRDSFTIISELPEVWGRHILGQVECLTISPQGRIFGGNAGDGQLFEINPVTMQLKNLGKPIGMNRLRGICFGNDGKLYGIAGGYPGYSHLFSFNDQEGFTDFGNPEFLMTAPGIDQGILWRGFQLGTITSSEDGKYIIMGEDESFSQILGFAIEENYVRRTGE